MIREKINPLLEEVEILRRNFEAARYHYPAYRLALVTASHVRIARKMFGDRIETYAGPYSFLDGVPALKSSKRIVFGAHGPYVEFTEEDAEFESVILEENAWRVKYDSHVKYIHRTPIGRDEKVYVSYADYDYGMSYIDLYALNPTGETDVPAQD